ncbi:hypothetical protein Btru_041498 [Bulinus truncatus]|nr:hypothetical protein Btru_041498 [Bulinus truncatus]
MDSLTSQIDWKSVNVFGGKRLLLAQLFQSLECNEVMRELASHLENVQINPSTVLTYLSIMFILFPKAPAEIKDYIKAQLATGLENSDLKKLTVAFLIARQSSAVGQDSFGSYSSWFESTFSSNCSLVSSRPKFSTLMKFLSSLVPSDGPEYLKVHIFKKPTFPSRCGDILEDYILLAKTRLKDLGETSNPAEEDIQKMLVSYEETGKIPTSFFRAWMFRKPYFLEVLLPALLKPRCLPEIPDTRMKFIDEIFKSVELDPNLHKKYIQLCEQEKHSWMEVVFNADDDELDTMILPPKEQMRLQLTKYCEGLDSGSTSQVSETLNSIIEAASRLLPTPNPIGTAPFQIDQTKPLSNSEKEFVQEITDVFQKMADQRITLQRLQGLEKLFAVLADHFSQFQSVICRHIIFTLMSQSHSETLLIQALAWVLVILAVSSHKKIIEVVITNAEIIQDRSCVYSSLQEAMFHSLDIGENIHLVDIWSFLVSYARKAIEYFDHRDRTSEKADVVIVDPSYCSLEDVVQEFIIKQLHLLGERFGIGHGTSSLTVSDTELDDVSQWSYSLFSTTRWLTLSSNIKPTLSDWVEFELKIDPRKDNLPRMQRTSYLWKTSSSFLDVGSSVGYKDTATFCTDLFLNLAKYLSCSTSPRIIFDLPPYLVFCNLSHVKVTQLHVEAALSVVKIFSSFISVKPRIVSSTDVDSFITHPVLSTSILVHNEVLNSLSLLKELQPKMLAELSEASHWAESLVQAGLSGIDSKPSLSRLNGAALFARMHNMATLSGVDFPDKIDNSDTQSLLYFLHHVTVFMINE